MIETTHKAPLEHGAIRVLTDSLGRQRGRLMWDAATRQWVEVDGGHAPGSVVDRKRKHRNAARGAGLCGCCCSRYPKPGLKTCDYCLSRGKRRYQELMRIVARAKAAGIA